MDVTNKNCDCFAQFVHWIYLLRDPIKYDIVFCPLHEAAPELLEALEALGVAPYDLDGYCFCLNQEQVDAGHTGECREAKAAIRKARGE